MRHLRFVLLYFVVLQIIVKASIQQDCPYNVFGEITDTLATVEQVKAFNHEILPLLQSLLLTDFFKFFKVNLARKCPFWNADGECALRDCHVKGCESKDLPDGFRNEECEDSHLGDLDPTITKSDERAIEQWTKHDDLKENTFCEIDDEKDSQAGYVDLLINPERYTGYKGPSAHRIWYSIYEENCFKEPTVYMPTDPKAGFCIEKRSFYRMISGLHTSINTHLSYRYLLKPSNPLQKDATFGPNVEEFKKRFHPSNEPTSQFRIRNLYFTYVVELKALVKAAPLLRRKQFFTNNEKLDAETRRAVNSLLDLIELNGNFFDESALFRGAPEEAGALKTEFRNHFRNISRIMDCVGCEKCRLWGKLQTQGMGTALRILFSGHEQPKEENSVTLPANFQLKRSEIVSLFNAFGRLATSVAAIDHFCELDNSCGADNDICTDPKFHSEL